MSGSPSSVAHPPHAFRTSSPSSPTQIVELIEARRGCAPAIQVDLARVAVGVSARDTEADRVSAAVLKQSAFKLGIAALVHADLGADSLVPRTDPDAVVAAALEILHARAAEGVTNLLGVRVVVGDGDVGAPQVDRAEVCLAGVALNVFGVGDVRRFKGRWIGAAERDHGECQKWEGNRRL